MGGLCQMLTFAYNVGGWVIANAYVSKISKYLEKKWKPIYIKKVKYKVILITKRVCRHHDTYLLTKILNFWILHEIISIEFSIFISKQKFR